MRLLKEHQLVGGNPLFGFKNSKIQLRGVFNQWHFPYVNQNSLNAIYYV
jgi:hypothetical protein